MSKRKAIKKSRDNLRQARLGNKPFVSDKEHDNARHLVVRKPSLEVVFLQSKGYHPKQIRPDSKKGLYEYIEPKTRRIYTPNVKSFKPWSLT